MNYFEYQQLFDTVLQNQNRQAPYDNDIYLNFTKLNKTRMKRWDNHLQLDVELLDELKNMRSPMHWIIITEPWCGDAAHIVPFLIKMAEQNNFITYDICLRDSQPFLIESYLTNGSKSIPKLVVRDEIGNDIFTWGPRPNRAQELVIGLKASNTDSDSIKIAIQNWYNNDKGASLCEELAECMKNLNTTPIYNSK